MNRSNMYDLHHYLADNTDDLNGNFPSQIAAAERVLDILRQPPWEQADKNAKREQLHTRLDNWYKSGPFSSQKWSTVPTDIAWQPLGDRARIFYEDMEFCIQNCISILNDPNTLVNHDDPDDTDYPVGHMLIFCDLVRLIMGTVDYTPLSREYRALINHNRSVLNEPNPVKTALQRDGVWVQLLKDIVAYVRCVEKEEEDFAGGFNPRESVCNLTKMTVSVEESRIALDTDHRRLLSNRRDLQEHAGLTIARHRHSQVIPETDPTHALMHKLLQLTQV